MDDVHVSAELLLRCKTPWAFTALVGINACVGRPVPFKPTQAFGLEIAVGALVDTLALWRSHYVSLGHVVRLLLDRCKFVRAELATVLMIKQVDVLHVAAHAEGRLEALTAEEALVLACRLLVVSVQVLDKRHICCDSLATKLTHVSHSPRMTLYVLLERAAVLKVLLAQGTLYGLPTTRCWGWTARWGFPIWSVALDVLLVHSEVE